MTEFRLVQFTSPHDFLEALQAYDDGFMNFSIGPLLDCMDEKKIKARKLKNIPKTLIAVYDGNTVVYVATLALSGFIHSYVYHYVQCDLNQSYGRLCMDSGVASRYRKGPRRSRDRNGSLIARRPSSHRNRPKVL